MSIIPNRSDTTIIEGDSGVNLDNLEVNEVPYKAADGTLQGSGLMRLTSGSLLAPVGFAVESGSVDFGDVLRLSESAGFLAFENMVDKGKYQLLDYAVPRDAASSKPFYFKLIEPQKTTQATTGSNTITTNPLSFEYTTQLTARTNALSFNAKEKMLNVRIRITDKNSGVAVKYFPSKSSWLTGEYGTTFEVGDNVIDFQDTALILQADTPLVFDIQADSISLSGENGIPAFSGLTQQGVFVSVADSGDIASLQTQINNVATPFSGKYSDLTGVPTTFSPSAHQHPTSDIIGLDTQLSSLTSGVQQANSSVSGLSNVARTGSYADILSKPMLFSGVYSDLTNKPILFDGKYTSLTDKPTSFAPSAHTHVIADVTGLQSALDGKMNSGSLASYVTTAAQTSVLAGYAPISSLPNYRRSDNTVVAAPIRVKYYTVTSDANSVWTVNLGTDFTEVLDVQATAISTASTIVGIRQASLNSYTPTSTTLTGTTFGNTTISTLLIGVGANTIALVPNTVVKLRVEGK